MQRFCLALDLVDDEELIAEYEQWHAEGIGWAEVRQNDLDSGIIDLQIYRTGNRMFMIMDTDDAFTFEKKASLDAINTYVEKWEKLMWKYQQPLPWAEEGQKWVLMKQIFQFEKRRDDE